MVFWDASALAKAYAQEQGTPSVLGALSASRGRGFLSDHVAIEVLTVFGKWFRTNRLSKSAYRNAVADFYRDYPSAFNLIEVDRGVRHHALSLAEALRGAGIGGMDILHLASAMHVQASVSPRPVILASSDAPLLNAATMHGLATFNPEVEPLAKVLGVLR
ncbi:MAG TPA: type II toxin-antitoxin system VapC family toxin [Longimicrobiaceae bacterium]